MRAYLDNNATTRLAPEALSAMTPFLTEIYLNPSSTAGELLGAARPLADARNSLARLLGAPELGHCFVLTSGASEANSWAVHAASFGRPPGHMVSTAIEHPSMISALEACRAAGWAVDLARPEQSGRVSPEAMAVLVRPETSFVSVQYANNETGVIQPVAEISAVIRDRCPQALFHVDATQALGRIPLSLDSALGMADLVSLSAHKFHGPKGIGALFVADCVRLSPLIHGGQEDGRRGGTPDVAAAAGLAAAASIALERLPRMEAVSRKRDRFEHKLAQQFGDVRILGSDADRLPNTSAFVLPGIDATAIVEALASRGVVIATGSACTSGSPSPSHVLLAMGVGYDEAKSALRVSLSHETNDEELDLALGELVRVCGGKPPATEGSSGSSGAQGTPASNGRPSEARSSPAAAEIG
ncbi:MAG TPA: cysteine desulfurase family protein [Allosphingosinicella sp.]|nr:cysteine desulfurase family protein [Allosphingosinicella sp.]